jgi:predicted O-methyltransferase YrrM
MLGTICTQILDQLEASDRTQGRALTIVETGTAYIMRLEKGETDLRERSTVAIAQWCKQQSRKVVFYSIDISEKHQADCGAKLQELGLRDYVQFLCGDSRAMLDSVPESFFDFALLDADSGGQTTLEEYKMVCPKMRRPGVVVVDDAFKDKTVNKAQFVMPLAYQQGRGLTEFYRQAVAISFDADEIVRAARAY